MVSRTSLATLLTTCLFLAPPAEATLVVALPLETLAETSDLVVQGTVVEVSALVLDGRVERRVVLEQTLDYTEGISSTRRVDVRALGGVAGDMATVVPGAETWEVGAEVVVFLQREENGDYRATALAQSLFVLDRDTPEVLARRSLRGVQRHAGAPSLPSTLPLRDLEDLILRSLHPDVP